MLKFPKKSEVLITLVLLAFYFLLLAQPINFSTADLGRHLKNGEVFFKEFKIPKTNLYSYTYPDYPFVNHHWGSGVVFYAVQKVFGFGGLALFSIILSLATFLIFFHIAKKEGGFWPASILALVSLPVIAYRAEIRPEVFSYLLAAVFLLVLWKHQRGELSSKKIFLLPLLMILWVNLHIYFFLGGALIFFFLFGNLWQKFIKKEGASRRTKELAAILILSGAAILLNPNFLKGALYPLKIFEDYGYRLLENQSILFLEKLFKYPPGLYFKILFAVTALAWLVFLRKTFKKKSKLNLSFFLMWLFFSTLAWKAVRNFTIFGYFSLALSPVNFKFLNAKTRSSYAKLAPVFFFVFVLAFITSVNPNFWRGRLSPGFGLQKGALDAADFFKKNSLRGPVFNNYDVGGYLIYNLYPKEQVFTDNRPEAYPSSFFNETYIPMQENEEKWQEADKKYNFQTIFFWRNDLTPWGQQFLARRFGDQKWALVFADNYHLIFVKK